MSPLTSEQLENLLNSLQPFISHLQQNGFNIGVDSYCSVHNLLLALAAQGKLPSDFSQLRTLLAPVLCCSEQEQVSFNRYFDDWLQVLQPKMQTPPAIVQEFAKVEQEAKKTKKSFYVLIFLVVLGFSVIPYRNYLAEIITSRFFGEPPALTDNVFNNSKSHTTKAIELPPEVIPQTPQEKPQPEFSDLDKAKYALWATLAVLALMLLWYLSRYLQIQRFLKRHSMLQPPEIAEFFVKNQEQKLYSSVTFARTAQQLHKHRNLDAQLLDVEATVKRTIAECGFYTPVYKAIKALPEYLVLIDRASFNDQLSQFVDSLLKQLDDFGLFIERYYFDGDSRRCYAARYPTTPCTLDSLQSLYSHHRLIIFSDSGHFLDPISGKLYGWLGKFQDWQSPFLFTLESPQHWDYGKQQLHEAGFVVLATGQKGLQDLVSYISADVESVQKQRGDVVDLYPALLQQRPRRFLERHAPVPDVADELFSQLDDYLGQDGVVWLAACAVYPELHWQLTLYLGQREDLTGFKNLSGLDEALLLRLARLPWLRYGYMPDWLREALLSKLNKQQEQAIRQRLQALLLTIAMQGSADDFSLSIAQKSPLLSMIREVLQVWQKKSDYDSAMQDYVFQSFMAGRLAVKLPKALNRRLVRFGLVQKMQLTVVTLIAVLGGIIYFLSSKPETTKEAGTPIVTLYNNWNIDACDTTDIARVHLPEESRLSKIVFWSDTSIAKDKLNGTIKGRNISEPFTTRRGSGCQWSWCEEIVDFNKGKILPAGDYTFNVNVESLCQNKKSNGNGYIRIEGSQINTVRMVAIKGGCFMMGSSETEPQRISYEQQHQVCVKDFQIGKYEVTQAQWQAVMGNNPSSFKGDNLPVETVSWNEVQVFIKKLNALTGKNYRLPTEAEWEYAARAGTTTPFYTGNCINTKQANYDGIYDYNNCGAKTGVELKQTVAVGSYPANPFGLYDMAGNVLEWTCSEYYKDYQRRENKCVSNNNVKMQRAVRGGSWGISPNWLRSATRGGISPDSYNFDLGFRLSRM